MAKKKSDGEGPEWITAFAALNLMYPHHGGWLGTKHLVAELLKDGKIQASAGRLWYSETASLSASWKDRADARVELNVEVDSSVWGSSRYWLEDMTNWRWPKNRFVITQRKKPAKRVFVEDVKFRTAQIAELLPAKSRKGIGGNKIRVEDWTKIGVALIELTKEGYFGPPNPTDEGTRGFGGKGQLVQKMLAMTDEAYARTHSYELFGPIYKEFYPETERLSSRKKEHDPF